MNNFYSTKELQNMDFAQLGSNVMIHKMTNIVGANNIHIGDNVRIDAFTCVVAFYGKCIIKNHVHIASHCNLICKGVINIGNYASISSGCKLFTASDDYSGDYMTSRTIPEKYTNVSCAPITLEDHAIIGACSIILPDVTIAQGVAIGANSLITTNCDAWGIYAGTPAQRIKDRSRKLLTVCKEFENE